MGIRTATLLLASLLVSAVGAVPAVAQSDEPPAIAGLIPGQAAIRDVRMAFDEPIKCKSQEQEEAGAPTVTACRSSRPSESPSLPQIVLIDGRVQSFQYLLEKGARLSKVFAALKKKLGEPMDGGEGSEGSLKGLRFWEFRKGSYRVGLAEVRVVRENGVTEKRLRVKVAPRDHSALKL